MNNGKLNAVLILTSVLTFFASGSVRAADFQDPMWPCQQRKVVDLSLGLMWPLAAAPQTAKTSPGAMDGLPPAARELAGRLELRRTSLDQADELVAAFAASNPDVSAQVLTLIYTDVFERLGKTRRRIIAGIGRYSLKQIDLAKKIDGARSEREALAQAEAPELARIEALDQQLEWDERVYRDRSRSLTYVCETPVLIEKRLYALAQILMKHMPDQTESPSRP